MRRVKRLISVILLMCMVATMLPAAAYAGEETEQYTEEFTEAESAEKAEQNTAETQVSESENITLYSSADSSGETELPEDSLCKVFIGKTGYSDIYTAVENASSGDTIVLCDDIELSSRLTVDKSITIKDDGKARKIYCCNTATDKSGGYGRGIQINGGYKLTIKSTDSGSLTIIGHSKRGDSYNAREAICIYNGSLVLDGIAITECSNSAVHGSDYNNLKYTITANKCCFSDNGRYSGYYAADICNCKVELTDVTADDIEIPEGCSCTLDGEVNAKLTLNSNVPEIELLDDFSEDSKVTVSSTEITEGLQLITAGATADKCKCFTLTGYSNTNRLAVGDNGYVEIQKVAIYINSDGEKTEVCSLKEAIENAKAESTVTVIADCDISSRIQVSKNLSITDDGAGHTVYVYNTDGSESGGYGRGIQLQSSKTLNVTGTSQGGLSFIGHSEDCASYNKASIFYVYTGILNLNGKVEISDCQTTYGTVFARTGAKAVFNGCYIHDNANTYENGGTAVCNQGTLYINEGTKIENNCASSSVAGAVFNGTDAVTSISGNVIIKDNKKNCSYQENEGVSDDGTESNIQISSPDSLVINDNISGTIGIDYTGDNNGVFGKLENTSITGKDCLIEDSGNYSRVTYDIAGNLYWNLQYSVSRGDSVTELSNYKYQLSNAGVTINSVSDNAKVISITADCGYFTVPSLPAGYSRFIGIKADNSYTTDFDSSVKYKGISVYADLSASAAGDFVKSIIFTTPGEGMTQTVSIGLSADENAVYFGGSSYNYCNSQATYDRAGIYTANSGKYLATISSSAENSFIYNTFEKNTGWIGATLQSGRWCWTGDPAESAVISGNASSSQGYNGAYVNWYTSENSSEPVSSNSYAYLDGTSGKWKTSDSSGSFGYYQESRDCCANRSIETAINAAEGVTKLNAVAPSFDGDIAMYYYFSFSKTLAESKASKVTVSVGGAAPEEYSISDIIADGVSEYGDYSLKVNMSAKQMSDNVEIKIYNGSSLVTSYGGANRTNYNLRYYADKVIKLQSAGGSDKYNESFSYDIVQLVKAMLNYGAAAQTQFGYNTGNLANKDYDDATADKYNITDLAVKAVYSTDDRDKNVFAEASLIAESSTILRIYLTGNFTATVDGVKSDIKKSQSGEYYFDIPVGAQNLSHIFSISANGKSLQINTYKVIYSLITDENVSDAARLTSYKLYLFGSAADSYYGVNVLNATAVEAVINTAYAYLNKAEYIQYDQATVTEQTAKYTDEAANWRRQVEVYPEDAVDEVSNLHMDCSSFIWNVYCDVFGTDNVEQTLNIKRYEVNTERLTNAEPDNITIKKCYTLPNSDLTVESLDLQPGDIIVKRSDGHGHVALWVGNGYIHCTGSSYDYDKATDKLDDGGAIRFVSADTFTEAWWSGFDTLTILRPLEALQSSDLSKYGQARSQLGSISVTKSAYVGTQKLYDGLSVNPGDTVTYKITVSNPSSKVFTCAEKTVNITDTDPGNSVHTFNNITVKPNETRTFEYDYIVPANASGTLSGGSGTLSISDSQGKTGADVGRGVIAFSAKSVAVESDAADEISSLQEKLDSLNGTAYESYGITYINSLMSEITGKTISLAKSDYSLFNSVLFTPYTLDNYYNVRIVNGDMPIKDYLVSNYASGRYVYNTSFDDDEFSTCQRVRKITTSNLQIGDIVAVNTDGSNYIYYIYLGDYGGSQSMLTISGESINVTQDADTVLDGLLANYSFAVLRVLGR